MIKGMKFDKGKDRWDLVPIDEFKEVVEVITYGANKYNDSNWKKISKERYFAALMRHIVAWRQGELTDKESGKLHLAHAISNALFIMWHDNNPQDLE